MQRDRSACSKVMGAEAVVPLDQNEKWIAAVAREMKAALAGNQTAMAAGDIVIPVYIGQSKLRHHCTCEPDQ